MSRSNTRLWRNQLSAWLAALVLVASYGLLAPATSVHAQETPDAVVLPQQETPVFANDLAAEMIYREALLIQTVNEKRREAGLLPLRWNRELADSARWFAHDSVETVVNCGHKDSLGRLPGARIRAFGFKQLSSFGENVVCGFTEPRAAVAAWMSSESQRNLLLSPSLREVGAGYYYSIEKGRGYIVLDLSVDPNFSPALLNNEALSTTSPAVTLTVHPQTAPAVTMKVSNSPTFEGVVWEPFSAERPWTLEGGNGWRWVYVLTRDAVGRTSLLSDVIYLGETPPKEEISLDHATNIGPGFSISWLKAPGNALLRLSLGWLVDSSDAEFAVLQGPGMTVDDPQALGGSALQMISGGLDGLVRATIYDMPVDRILTAYVRVKSPLAGGDTEMGEIRVRAGGEIINVVPLNSADFGAAGEYQEVALDFAFGASPLSSDVQVEVVRIGDVDLTVDAVRFFGRAVPVEQASLWSAGSSYYRSQGVVGRWETDQGLSEPFDVAVATVDPSSMQPVLPPGLSPNPTEVKFSSYDGKLSDYSETIFVCGPGCANVRWQASTDSEWLNVAAVGDGLIVGPRFEGLTRGPYIARVTLTPTSVPAGATVSPASVLVKLVVDYPDPSPNPDDPPVDPPPPQATFDFAYIPTAHR